MFTTQNLVLKYNLISSSIELFYNNAPGEDRLSKGMGVFKFERIKYLICLYFIHSSTILDIGGGTGKYAEWI